MQPLLIYCYDAYCGWCYGFSPVMKKIEEAYKDRLQIEVLSGGMVLPEQPVHISATAEYIKGAYKTVEDYTGIKFGEDYLWHINHPDQSDWFPSSEKPAVAMVVLREFQPDRQVEFAADLQFALNFEGRDLCDNEAYRHLLNKYDLDETIFYSQLKDPTYLEKARYDFALCQQLQVTGYPSVFIQASDSKFYLVARGYTDYETVSSRIRSVLSSQ